jgi:8-oxo-dGTP diphosphatase
VSESKRPGASTDGDARAEPTPVVTCFVVRRDRGIDELLLVRRSERVRTYRGRWAGVSGYIEPGVTPLEQAYVELREEARLAETDLALVRTGTPLPVHDAAAGLEWVVHPFLFLVMAPERIEIDWEAQEMRWVAPDEVPKLETVPGLVEALARVYPPDAYPSNAASG